MIRENHANGGDEYPPTRLGFMTFLLGAAVITAGALIMNWEAISALIHFPQIKSSLGL
jgi:hypothetical protein